LHRTGQGLLVLKHRAEIAHVEITAAQFAFKKVLGFTKRRPAAASCSQSCSAQMCTYSARNGVHRADERIA
jgi:hypothetical protein